MAYILAYLALVRDETKTQLNAHKHGNEGIIMDAKWIVTSNEYEWSRIDRDIAKHTYTQVCPAINANHKHAHTCQNISMILGQMPIHGLLIFYQEQLEAGHAQPRLSFVF